MSEAALEVRNLSVTLNGTAVLSGLNFRVEEGEFLTIMGPNGAGKTVLVRALLGLMPHEGEVKWRPGIKIGYLPQGLNQMFVRDVPVTVGEFFGLRRVGAAETARCLELVGLPRAMAQKPAGYLSGGEFQRMLVAWVLAGRPQAVVLDEPTTAVDVAGGETIYSILGKAGREEKLTILNVTHDLNVVFAHSTHVLCLSRVGHRCFGVPREVLTPEVLNELYGAQLKFYTHP